MNDKMDTKEEEIKFPLRILVDRERSKVVFAEAESDFIDTLFSFLTLPMGTIVRILKNHPDSQPEAIGSLKTLYEGLENLQAKHLWAEECKNMLLNPRNSAEALCCKLKLNIDDTDPTKYFICENWSCSRGSTAYFSLYNTVKCNCGKLLNREISANSDVKTDHTVEGGVFVTETATFVISDDLHIIPNLPGSALELLNDLGIRDISILEEITLDIGIKEMLNLLKWSLQSESPLTHMFLSKRHIISGIVKSKPDQSAEPQMDNETTTNTMIVKIIVRKSSNKVLFAQAEENFVDFLFSLLTIPLGGVLCLLGGNTSVGSIGNLYRSISMLNTGRYIKTQELKDMLLNPRLASLYLRKNQIFPLRELSLPQYYCFSSCTNSGQYTGHLVLQTIYCYQGHACSRMSLKNPKIQEEFIRGPAMFMVTDDLVVSPLSSISSISFLKRFKVPLCDVEERMISIGMDEALKILKASLECTTALTSSLILMAK